MATKPVTNVALVAAAAVDVARAAVDSEEVTYVATEPAINITLVAAATIQTGVATIEAATSVVAGRSNAIASARIVAVAGDHIIEIIGRTTDAVPIAASISSVAGESCAKVSSFGAVVAASAGNSFQRSTFSAVSLVAADSFVCDILD